MNLKSFEVITDTKFGKCIFLTKARCGKIALDNLINYSYDFKKILNDSNSDNMCIKIKRVFGVRTK